jgi:hypothetical protein
MSNNKLKQQLQDAIIRQDASRVKSILATSRKLKERNDKKSYTDKKKLMPQILTSLIRSLKQ